MIRYYFFIIFFFSALTLQAQIPHQIPQKPKSAFKVKLVEANVNLSTGERISGQMNPRILALNFLNIKTETGIHNLDPAKVKQFVYLDGKGHKRTYYSLEGILIQDYKPEDRAAFYEVIYESDDFAVLGYHRAELKDEKRNRVYDPINDEYSPIPVFELYEEASFEEVIFILRQDGEVLPFLKLTEPDKFEINLWQKSKVLNKKIIRQIFPGQEAAIEDYMKENGLSLKRIDDMHNIFGFADSL